MTALPEPGTGSPLAAPRLSIPKARRRRGPADWLGVGGMTLLAVSALFPFYFMTSNAFRTQADWNNSKLGLPTVLNFDAFSRAWTGAQIPTYFRNSVLVVAGTVVFSVVVASMAGYAFSKLRWRGRDGVFLFTLAWMAIPPLLLMVPIYVEMVNLGLVDSKWSVILLYTALNLPFNTYLMTTFFRRVPDELLEAARIEGASIHQLFRQVMLPMARPALATLCIFNFLWAWNEFVFALLLLPTDSSKTLTVGVLQLQSRFNTNYPALMAGLLITSLPVIGVYLVFQRHLVRAISAGALK
jgi:ABC-type glycerol-3-phosphate transport system permease component